MVIVGIFLVTFTTGLYTDILRFWPLILASLAVILFLREYEHERVRENLIAPLFLFLFSIYLLCINVRVFSFSETWVMLLFIFGISFFIYYAFNPRNHEALLTSFIIVLITAVISVIKYHKLSRDVIEYLIKSWPVLLVALGIYVIFSPHSRKRK